MTVTQRLTPGHRRAGKVTAQQGGSSGHLTPHTSFTASQQASTMSTRHTQSWHTHCQRTGTIICPGTRGKQRHTLRRVFPLSSLRRNPRLSLSAHSPHCGWWPQLKLLIPQVLSPLSRTSQTRFSLSSLSETRLSLSTPKPATHIQTHIHMYMPPPIHGFVTLPPLLQKGRPGRPQLPAK